MDDNNETPDPLDFASVPASLDYSTPDPTAINRAYGCIRAEPDPSLPRYAPPPAHIDLLPSSVDLRPFMPPVTNQGATSSCTAHAWSGLVRYLRKHARPALQDWQPSRLFIYYNERAMEGQANQDAGAAISDGARTLASQGVCPETLWPFDFGRVTSRPGQDAYAAAAPHRVVQPTPIDNRNIHALKSCLALGHPFVFGFTVYESFESRAVASTGMVPMPRQGEKSPGAHAVLGCGFDDSRNVFIFENSYDVTWGDGGFGYFPYAYLTDARLASDFWMARACS